MRRLNINTGSNRHFLDSIFAREGSSVALRAPSHTSLAFASQMLARTNGQKTPASTVTSINISPIEKNTSLASLSGMLARTLLSHCDCLRNLVPSLANPNHS
jgi:hypothetical protein